ncbi:M48 family metallopeptidase [Nocardioides sp. BP30]|uniref:M48 family metallopeptidase n=1 Tax=Nocardioides sp. BP30 TaxID=3036374 RepID=UPI0024696ACE|nr:M48 family metallopeptidase [Nocardioides sp. BP30]WGL53434.1 M48 family metallopeptidase [Nocardioides sp. BP30]
MAVPSRSRVVLTDISSRTWEHPTDRGALVALRKLKGFDTVIRTMNGLVSERATRLVLLGSAVRVDERQFPVAHRLLAEVGQVLDARELPELYVVNDPTTNAVTIGMDKPVIVLNSGLVDLLDEEELRFVLGHELGHALSGHAVYRTLLMRLLHFSGLFSALPLGGLGLRVIVAALMEWSRTSELSADRAGLLATQDPAVALRVHMKLAGGGHLADLDAASFLAQGAEYRASGDLRDSFLRLTLVEQASHPFAVVRAAEARRWVDGGEYTAILGGAYPRREEDAGAPVSEAARQAAAHYAESFARAQDALAGALRDLGGLVGVAKGWFDERFGRH